MITVEDIVDAIKDIKSDSAAGPDGIPAIFFKKCAEELCRPLKLIWEKSHSTDTVPDFYKKTLIPPQYKKLIMLLHQIIVL